MSAAVWNITVLQAWLVSKSFYTGPCAWANDRLSAILSVTADCRIAYDNHTLCRATMTKQTLFSMAATCLSIVKIKVSKLTDRFVCLPRPKGQEDACPARRMYLEKLSQWYSETVVLWGYKSYPQKHRVTVLFRPLEMSHISEILHSYPLTCICVQLVKNVPFWAKIWPSFPVLL